MPIECPADKNAMPIECPADKNAMPKECPADKKGMPKGAVPIRTPGKNEKTATKKTRSHNKVSDSYLKKKRSFGWSIRFF